MMAPGRVIIQPQPPPRRSIRFLRCQRRTRVLKSRRNLLACYMALGEQMRQAIPDPIFPNHSNPISIQEKIMELGIPWLLLKWEEAWEIIPRCLSERGLMSNIRRSRRPDARWRKKRMWISRFLSMMTWRQDHEERAVNRLRERTITLSDRKAGVSHAKNLMAMRVSKNLEEV